MNYFSKIKNLFSKPKQQDPTSTGLEIYQYENYDLGYSKNTELLKEMRGWVFSCVNAIADELAQIEIKLYKRNKDKVEEIKEHPILDVIYKVNDFTTKFDLFWMMGSYLELTGEAPLYLEKNNVGVSNIYFLSPDKITPIADKEKIISGYKYQVGMGKEMIIPKDEILFLKYINPANQFRGLGTLEAAARAVDIDNYSEIWNMNFFKNSARPDAVLTVDQPQMTKEQKDVLKNSIREQYQGVKKAHNLMVLFGNMKLDKFATTQKDMDFYEQQKFIRDKIFGIFRVPKAILAQTDGVNYASASAAQYVFARWTIKPKIERIIQQFNEFFVPLFDNSEGLFLDYINPIPEDEEAKLNLYSKAVNNWMTINEVRDLEGLPPLENGDELYLPFNLVSMGKEKENIPPVKSIKLNKDNIIKKDLFQSRKAHLNIRDKNKIEVKEKIEKIKDEIKKELREVLSKEVSPEKLLKWGSKKKQDFWFAKDKIFKKFVKEVRDKQKKIFEIQEKEVIDKLNKAKSIKSSLDINDLQLNKVAQEKLTIKVMLPILEDIFKEGADETFNFLGVDMVMDITSNEVQTLLKDKCRKFAFDATEYTNIQIKDVVAEGIKLEESIPQIKERIKLVFDNAKAYRAERISRTETVRFNSAATQRAFEESGVVEGKEWVVEPDACEFCVPMAGKTVGLSDSFFKKGDTTTGNDGGEMTLDYDTTEFPPLHPNCRCSISPIYKETKSIKPKNNLINASRLND